MMMYRVAKMWQTTGLDHCVAEELFGWRWLAYTGTPTRSTPGYPKKCTVRQFFPPESQLNERWKPWFESVGGAVPANGDEPLDYRYCSSQGGFSVPHFSGDEDDCRSMEKEISKRKLWSKYQGILAKQCDALDDNGDIESEALHFASCEDRCIAALATVGSRYVVEDNYSGSDVASRSTSPV